MSTELRARGQALLLGAVVFVFYLFTLAPSLVWADGGRMQLDAATGGSLYWHLDELSVVATDGWPFDRLGVAAWDHPLWVMIGHVLVVAVPVDDPAWLLNLLSAVPAALTVVVLFAIVGRLTADTWAAAGAGLALAVSHTFWFHAVTAEVYALHALFMVLLVWMAVSWTDLTPRRFAVLAFVAGLGLANHVMLALTVVPVAVFVAARHRRGRRDEGPRRSWLGWADVRRAMLFFALGWAPWWVQFARMSAVAGFASTTSVATGFPWLDGRWPGPLGTGLLTNAGTYLGTLVYQFTPVGVAAGVYGAWWAWRRCRRETMLLLALFVLHAAFSANYDVAQQFALHLPSYVVFATFIGCGVGGVVARFRPASEVRDLAGRHHAGPRPADPRPADPPPVGRHSVDRPSVDRPHDIAPPVGRHSIDRHSIDRHSIDRHSIDRYEEPRRDQDHGEDYPVDRHPVDRHPVGRHREGRYATVRLRVVGALAVAAMALPVAVYALVPGFLAGPDTPVGVLAVRGDDSAATFGRQALEGLAADALVLIAWPDDTESYVSMRYYQLTQDVRTDVTLDPMLLTGLSPHASVLQITASQRGCRPIYLPSADAAAYPVEALRRDFTIVTEGHVVRLQPINTRARQCDAPAKTSANLDDLLTRVRR